MCNPCRVVSHILKGCPAVDPCTEGRWPQRALDLPAVAGQDLDLRKDRKQLEFVWRGSPAYGTWGDIWTLAMETGTLQCAEHAAGQPSHALPRLM